MPQFNPPIEFVPDTDAKAEDVQAFLDYVAAFLNVGKLDADNIQNGSIVAVLIANGAVETAKIANGAVETAKIADGAVETAKIADRAVTPAKLDLDTVEYTRDHTVTNAGSQIVIREEPAPGTYLVFAGAWITDSTNALANGFLLLMKNSSPVANSLVVVAGDANRSTAIRPTKVEIGEGDTIGVRFDRFGSVTGWTLSTYLTLLRIG